MANSRASKPDRFRELLDAHYKQHYSVQQYAALLSVSVKQLNRVCKAGAGKTAGACVQQRLNAEAKRLLYNTPLSVKEVAFALGFREPSHFSHFFAKHNGMFPHFFREMMLDRKEEAIICIGMSFLCIAAASGAGYIYIIQVPFIYTTKDGLSGKQLPDHLGHVCVRVCAVRTPVAA